MVAKEDNKPLISVIVPIYNVEKYVQRCLDSLKGQTLREIEVICIDDGSTDESGRIADAYRRDEFPVFRIIHTENRGLSAARNRGIDEARTDWIMFVDSDDWVDKDFCRAPYEAALEKLLSTNTELIFVCFQTAQNLTFPGADLVIFEADMKNGRLRFVKQDKRAKVISEITAHNVGGVAAWNKLYKKELFANIKYPEQRTYEDVATTHKIVHRAKQIVMMSAKLYFYNKRRGSISNTHTYEYSVDRFLSYCEKSEDFIAWNYPMLNIEKMKCASAISVIAYSSSVNDDMYNKAKSVLDSIHKIPRGLMIKQRCALNLWRINERAFRHLAKMVNKNS